MNGAFYIGAISLDAQQRALDVVANNIANLNTTAFKRQGINFTSLVSPQGAANTDGGSDSVLASAPAGVTIAATPTVWTQGTVSPTGKPLDLAIQGDGFLEVLGAGGRDLLWRGGSLSATQDGYLATSDGKILKAMISVPTGAQHLVIDPSGTVSASVNGATQQIGQLDLVLAKDPSALTDDGGGYYELSDPAAAYAVKPGQEGGGTLVQGALETSNVQLADEMITLLLTQRAYGASAQVVQAGDQLMSIVNGLRR
jgi:flagellar basal-body rod protein FlgG